MYIYRLYMSYSKKTAAIEKKERKNDIELVQFKIG